MNNTPFVVFVSAYPSPSATRLVSSTVPDGF